MMTGHEIRQSFLDFFRDRGHTIVPSASLVPAEDPTLLFTNAGMVQFKNVFLGRERRSYVRAADSQRCLRISGKHNDLESVGRDTYHHTFFEMLGNWSFGDYGKREAIAWAWELLTEVWRLPKGRIWATVFRTDEEAEACWREVTDLGRDRILRAGERENFWEMGETGPCGPCSEIHFDRGAHACDRQGDPQHRCAVNGGCARFIELWNLVFIQHDRQPDGRLVDLPARHVDTGMGLERLAALLQGVRGNYDSDLLREVIRAVEEASGRRYGAGGETDVAFRVIADHVRAVTFMIADGITPANEGRGYVLRRLLRRAARHGRTLGFEEPFLSRIVEGVVATLGGAYPEIVSERRMIEETIAAEEERFTATLGKGLVLLDDEVRRLRQRGGRELDGEVAFRLYDTYGFPLDLTEDILRGEGLSVDREGFERGMEVQRARAREAHRFGLATQSIGGELVSRFVGDGVYEWESRVTAVLVDGDVQTSGAREGAAVEIVVPETPFYGESGGQVGDRGTIETEGGGLIEVTDAQKPRADLTVHRGTVVCGAVAPGERVRLRVDRERREAARLNHSATHVLHAALREILGRHVRQAGSLVAPERLRFDFTHSRPVGEAELRTIEDLVNARIRDNAEVRTEEMSFDEAMRRGALAFFGEKYGERVRVVSMGEFSVELCGGTHARRTGDIGFFRLRGESGVAAGVRRIEALTGGGALEWVRRREDLLRQVGRALKSGEENVLERVERLLAQQRDLERRIAHLQGRLAGGAAAQDLLAAARQVNGVTVVTARADDVDDKGLRLLADRLRERLGSGVVVLGSEHRGRALLLAAVTKDLCSRVDAGRLIKQLAPVVGGDGGGRADFAQAGGRDPTRLDEALSRVDEVLGGDRS